MVLYCFSGGGLATKSFPFFNIVDCLKAIFSDDEAYRLADGRPHTDLLVVIGFG